MDRYNRIVTLAPSINDILIALGVQDKIVGTIDPCPFPELQNCFNLGSFSEPNLDLIKLQKPDLILGIEGIHTLYLDSFYEITESVLLFAPKNLQNILEDIELLASLTGVKNKVDLLISELRGKVKFVKDKYRRKKLRSFFLVSPDPLFIPPTSSYQYEAILAAGGEPFSIKSENSWVQISIMDVLEFDPEIIFSCGGRINLDKKYFKRCKGCKIINPACQRNVNDIKGWNFWSQTTAARKGHIYGLNCEDICYPSPSIFNGIEYMAKLIWEAN